MSGGSISYSVYLCQIKIFDYLFKIDCIIFDGVV